MGWWWEARCLLALGAVLWALCRMQVPESLLREALRDALARRAKVPVRVRSLQLSLALLPAPATDTLVLRVCAQGVALTDEAGALMVFLESVEGQVGLWPALCMALGLGAAEELDVQALALRGVQIHVKRTAEGSFNLKAIGGDNSDSNSEVEAEDRGEAAASAAADPMTAADAEADAHADADLTAESQKEKVAEAVVSVPPPCSKQTPSMSLLSAARGLGLSPARGIGAAEKASSRFSRLAQGVIRTTTTMAAEAVEAYEEGGVRGLATKTKHQVRAGLSSLATEVRTQAKAVRHARITELHSLLRGKRNSAAPLLHSEQTLRLQLPFLSTSAARRAALAQQQARRAVDRPPLRVRMELFEICDLSIFLHEVLPPRLRYLEDKPIVVPGLELLDVGTLGSCSVGLVRSRDDVGKYTTVARDITFEDPLAPRQTDAKRAVCAQGDADGPDQDRPSKAEGGSERLAKDLAEARGVGVTFKQLQWVVERELVAIMLTHNVGSKVMDTLQHVRNVISRPFTTVSEAFQGVTQSAPATPTGGAVPRHQLSSLADAKGAGVAEAQAAAVTKTGGDLDEHNNNKGATRDEDEPENEIRSAAAAPDPTTPALITSTSIFEEDAVLIDEHDFSPTKPH